jgi:hypothetical protein
MRNDGEKNMTILQLHLDDKRLNWLRKQADLEHKAIEDVVFEVLDEKMIETDGNSDNLLLMLAELADRFEPISKRTDVSENFDAIIGEMMAEDIAKRHETTHGDE